MHPAENTPIRPNWRRRAVTLLLAAAVLVQTIVLLRSAGLELQRSLSDLPQNAAWRGAKISSGRRFAQYLKFLNAHIPADARVLLPPAEVGPRALTYTPMMQFFLAPRPVFNCAGQVCSGALPGDVYIVTVGDFPGAQAPAGATQLRYDEEWGLLVPAGSRESAGPGWPGFSSLVAVGLAALAPLAWLALLALAGMGVVRLLLPERGNAGLALGYGLGLAGLTILLAAASLAGLRLTTGLTWAISALLAAGGLAALLRSGRTAAALPHRWRPDPWGISFWLLSGLAALVGVSRAYAVTDELVLWGIKGYGMAADGELANVTGWGTNTVAYPLHIPLLITAFRLLGGEALPAAKLAFAGYYLALLFVLQRFFLSRGLAPRLAGLAALLVGTAPLVFRHATLAYANLPLAFYLLSGALLLSRAFDPAGEVGLKGRLLLSGLLLAAAAWTRPEGLALGGLVLALAALALLRWRPFRLRQLGWALLPLLGYLLLWAGVQAAAYDQPLRRAGLLENAAGRILAGSLHMNEALYVLRSALGSSFDLPTWGALGLAVILALLATLLTGVWGARRTPWPRAMILLAGSGLLICAAITGMYYLASYDANHDISWWISTGLERMLLPGVLILWAAGAALLQFQDHRQDHSAALDPE